MNYIKIRLGIIWLVLLIIGVQVKAQLPDYSPTVISKYYKLEYAQASAYMFTTRDTNWSPIKPTITLWQNAGIDTSLWMYDGSYWRGVGSGASLSGAGFSTDELDTVLSLTGAKTTLILPHGLGYTPASATVNVYDSTYGTPVYTLNATNIYLSYPVAPVGTFNYKISFHRKLSSVTSGGGSGGGGGGGSGANNYTTAVAFNPTTYALTTTRSGIAALTTSLTHSHPISAITNLADSLLSKANKTGTNATGTWPIGITGNAVTVTNGLYNTSHYDNPVWIDSLNYSKIRGKPTALSSFTNDGGYITTAGEADQVFIAHVANTITGTNIANWGTAYNKRVTGAAFTGSSTKILTLTLGDGSTLTPSFSDNGSVSGGGVTTYNDRTGAVTPQSGDYTTSIVDEGINLYWTLARFDASFAAKTTTDLTEGANLYWTTTRGDERITLQKGANSGLATLDGSGKVPLTQLPVGAQVYKGTWDASTNTPTLADGTGTNGDTYRVGIGATRDLGSGSIVWAAGDDAIYNGTIWQNNPAGSPGVSSVNSQIGAVSLTTTDIPEGTNLYSTTARIRTGISVSGSLAYNSGTGVLSYTTPTIPTQFNPIAGSNVSISGTYPNITFNSSATTGVSSFAARTGDVVPQTGDYTYAQIGSKPSTITGFAADGVSTAGSYANPTWITTLAGAKITGTVPSATNFTGTLVGDITGTQAATVIGANTVTTAKIVDATIVNADLAASGFDASKITTGTLPAAQTPAYTGDVTKPSGSGVTTLAASGVTAGTYTKLTVNTKGLATVGASLLAADIPALDAAKITTGIFPIARGGLGIGAYGTALQIMRMNAAGTAIEFASPTSGGTVVNFASGNLAPLFTTAVSSPALSPSQTFTLSTAAANTILGNSTGATAAPTYFNPSLTSTLFTNEGTANTFLAGNPAGNLSFRGVDLSTADVTGILPVSKGGFGALIINSQTANYTVVLSDANKTLVEMNKTSAQNLTIPTNATTAFPIGSQVTFYQGTAFRVTVVATAGVTLKSADGNVKTRVQNSSGTVIKTGINTWLLVGDIAP